MEWFSFLRLAIAFGIVHCMLPAWAGGTNETARWVAAFVRFSIFIAALVLLLGFADLALPGIVVPACFAWPTAIFVRRQRDQLRSSEGRQRWTIRLLREFPSKWRTLPLWFHRWNRPAVIVGILLAAFLTVEARFPVSNLRLTDTAAYGHSLSLASLSNGHTWTPDLSAALLLPAHYLSGLSAPRTVSLSAPVIGGLLILGVAFAVLQISQSPFSASLSAGIIASLRHVSESLQPNLAYNGLEWVFLLLAAGLWISSRRDAVLAGLLGLAILASTRDFELGVPYLYCIGLGIGCAGASRYRPMKPLFTAGLVAAVCIAAAIPSRAREDGPLQYEKAARIAYELTISQSRNTWLLASPTEDLAFVYGSGWHMELEDLVERLESAPLGDPQFVPNLPVQDLFVLIERRPLPGSGLERAAIEFQAAQLMSRYAKSHGTTRIVYADCDLVLFHVPISGGS